MKIWHALLCGTLLIGAGSRGERVHLYDFEKGAKDAAGSLNSDRLMNVQFVKDPVRGGQVARFSGEVSYIDFPACSLGEQFSLAVWLSPEKGPSVNGRDPIGVIFSSGGIGRKPGVKWYLNNHFIEGRNGYLTLDAKSTDGKGLAATVPAAVSYDEWSLLVVTVDSNENTVTFYRNGAPVGTGELIPGYKDNALFKLGGFFGKTNRWSFQGAMDDFSIYNHVLGAEEVGELYNESK
jgi:hypothetical protein